MAHGFLSVQKFPLRLRISMSGKNPSTRKFSAFSAPWYKHSITSLVPVEGKIISKAPQSLHPKCRPSDYRLRGISTDWLQAPWKPNVSMCLHFVHNGHASFFHKLCIHSNGAAVVVTRHLAIKSFLRSFFCLEKIARPN